VIEVLHPKPVFVVQITADPAVLHEVMVSAVGEAAPDVALPTTVFAACVAKPERGRPTRFAAFPEAGVPKTGAVMVGAVKVSPAIVAVVPPIVIVVEPMTVVLMISAFEKTPNVVVLNASFRSNDPPCAR
jgi:hypothetical protein